MTHATDPVGVLRTWLYVPGHRERLLAGAVGRGADAVIADLEDAVPVAERGAARSLVAAWLTATADAVAPSARWVRLGVAELAADVAAVVGPTLDGIVLAKADLALLRALEAPLATAEHAAGVPEGATPVIALLETATAILDAPQIARMPRVASLAIGEADLAAELRITPSPDGREMLAARGQVVLAAAAAGLPAPMGPVCTEFSDLDLLAEVSREVIAQGFGALAAIHPAQVAVLRRALMPDDDAVARARGVLAALQAADGAAAVGPDGRMIDEAVARQAREVLDRAQGPAPRG